MLVGNFTTEARKGKRCFRQVRHWLEEKKGLNIKAKGKTTGQDSTEDPSSPGYRLQRSNGPSFAGNGHGNESRFGGVGKAKPSEARKGRGFNQKKETPLTGAAVMTKKGTVKKKKSKSHNCGGGIKGDPKIGPNKKSPRPEKKETVGT